MYYVYKQPNGLPCVTECEQVGLKLIGTADSKEDAEKKLKLYLLINMNNYSDGRKPKKIIK